MIWFHFQRSIGEDAAKLLKTLREDQNDDNNKEYFKLLKEFLEIVETIKAEVIYFVLRYLIVIKENIIMFQKFATDKKFQFQNSLRGFFF